MPPESARRSNAPVRRAPILAAALAVAFLLQAALASRQHSLTYDEPSFIASGLSYIAHGDFRMNPEAPPLLQQLVALPLLPMELELVTTADPIWAAGDHYMLGQALLAKHVDRLPQIAFRARLPVLMLGSLLVLAIYRWCAALYGRGPALVATLFAATSPELVAHAGLATTDLGCAALMFVAVWSLWASLDGGRTARWAICGLATGLALVAKYTALLLGPIYLLVCAGELAARRVSVRELALGAAIVVAVAIATVGAGYGLAFDPRLYLHGLGAVYGNATAGYQWYLLGETSTEPWWYYHLAAYLMKVPLPFLAMLVLALAAAARDRTTRRATLFLLVPALTVLVASCFDAANLGLRRILPAFPFLVAFVAQAAASARGRPARAVIGALGLWAAVEAARIYPHHLSYFNQAAGGPERGPERLDDSNVDWGQDLPALAAWQRAHPHVRPLRLLYFGSAPPSAYGVDAIPMDPRLAMAPPPGYYAVSAHILAGFRKRVASHGAEVDWLSRYRPVGRAGYSIYIYEFR